MSNETFAKPPGNTEQVEMQPRVMMDHASTISDQNGLGVLKLSDFNNNTQSEKNANPSGKLPTTESNKEANKEPKGDIDCSALLEFSKSRSNNPDDLKAVEWINNGRNGGPKGDLSKDNGQQSAKELIDGAKPTERGETSIDFTTESYDLPDGGTLITAKHLFQKTPFNPILRDKDGNFQKLVGGGGSGAPGQPTTYHHEWSNGAKGRFTDGDDNYHYTDPTGKTSIIKMKDKAYGQ